MSESKCRVNGKHLEICDVLSNALSGSSPTAKSKGLFLPYRVNIKTGEKGTDIVQLHSGKFVGSGVALNFCPFCGESLKTWEGRQPMSNIEKQALRDDMRQVRERLEATVKRIAEQREYYEGVIADGSKRIAELERSETQLINERDSAESALNDAYKAVMGQAPEWSNWFSFENAIDEIELVCELWRNQTDDVIQFRQRIQELEAKLANPVLLPKTNGYWNEQEKVYEEAITLAKQRIRMAGFRCEGE
ncbi:ead/Ea22-like family protein [Salmonella enterica subsp. enterica serovar Bredeney]|uniref:ead/Ea22-like family protein n=1 Tax=Salmonella enterica TaxID=28901 RepID=UPI001A0729E1|nr:ead/Ea22-like family protein [Salmonella enterica subsp. enterica serovar Bredeney]EHE0822791.1 ead/Ea22-like family protein [Salmonella enterica subsp. enterica serovar Bredeney]